MAKKKGNIFGQTVIYEKTFKGTSQGRRPITKTMNKKKRQGRTRKQMRKALGRGQGR